MLSRELGEACKRPGEECSKEGRQQVQGSETRTQVAHGGGGGGGEEEEGEGGRPEWFGGRE